MLIRTNENFYGFLQLKSYILLTLYALKQIKEGTAYVEVSYIDEKD